MRQGLREVKRILTEAEEDCVIREAQAAGLGLVLALCGCGGSGGKTVTVIQERKVVVRLSGDGPANQRALSQDSAAKSDARNAVSEVESCYVSAEGYEPCGNDSLAESGLPVGSRAGQVEITDTTDETYSIVAHSESGNDFSIEKVDDGSDFGTVKRTCTTAVDGGCDNGTW